MSTQRHVILRQTLALSVAAEADAWPLQDAARRAQGAILRVLERCCDELSAPDRVHRIARLELDLGTLAMGSFEDDVAVKLAAALRTGLAAAIAGLEADAAPPRHASQWELLAGYLLRGRLPWWADAALAGQPQASLALLLREAPAPLRRDLAPLLADGHVLGRLAGNFPDTSLARLAALLLPQLGGFPGALAQALLAIAADAPGSVSAAAWRRRVWQGVLGNALPAALAATSRLDYSRSVLLRLAGGSAGAYRALVRQMRDVDAATDSDGQLDREGVADVLARLDADPSVAQSVSAGQAPGLLPPGTALPAEGAQAMPQVPQQLSQQAPQQVRQQVRQQTSQHSTGAPAKLAISLPPPPAGADAPPPPGWPHGAAPPRAMPDLDQDAIPLLNAGLIILWPFLKTLLERVELLGETGFRDAAARGRGAILLHCLASGEANAPEYLLPLNKVLCGLPLDAPIDTDVPLGPDEIAECERLLAAVIGQVAILENMSVAGFRASFLLRAGMLGVRDGAWLLRVERAPHDLVLDRFPWGFEWVKLPWMQDRMQVEW